MAYRVQIEDEYGEKIGMSRRDIARMMGYGDARKAIRAVEGMSEDERLEFLKTVSRDTVWPQFDWDHFDSEKHNLGRELLLHEMRKITPASGEATTEYLENVLKTREAAEALADAKYGGEPYSWDNIEPKLLAFSEIWGEKTGEAMRMAFRSADDFLEKAEIIGFPEFRTPVALNSNYDIEMYNIDDPDDKRIVMQHTARGKTIERVFDDRDDLRKFLADMRDQRKDIDVPVRPQFLHITRKGFTEDSKNVDEQELLERFSLRGYESGNWLSQDDRRQNILHVVDAFADLAKCVGIPEKMIGGGQLALGLGSRGNGGSAVAHYEPARRVINLTKIKGAGALAHEWGHYLDYCVFKGRASKEAFEALAYRKPRNEYEKICVFRKTPEGKACERAFLSLLKPGKNMEPDLAKNYAARLRYAKAKLHNAMNVKEYMGIFEEIIRREIVEFRRDNETARGMEKFLSETGEILSGIDKVETDFYKNSKMLGRYWRRPDEMWARAFESFVYSQLVLRDLRSDYLVAPYVHRISPYPPKHEMRQIYGAIESVLRDFRESAGLEPGFPNPGIPRTKTLKDLADDRMPQPKRLEVPLNPWNSYAKKMMDRAAEESAPKMDQKTLMDIQAMSCAPKRDESEIAAAADKGGPRKTQGFLLK